MKNENNIIISSIGAVVYLISSLSFVLWKEGIMTCLLVFLI